MIASVADLAHIRALTEDDPVPDQGGGHDHVDLGLAGGQGHVGGLVLATGESQSHHVDTGAGPSRGTASLLLLYRALILYAGFHVYMFFREKKRSRKSRSRSKTRSSKSRRHSRSRSKLVP